MFNVLQKGDKFIDINNSEVEIIGGVQMGVNFIAFREGSLPLIFKINYDKNVRVFCSEEFKALIGKAGISGLIFDSNFQ